MYLKELDKQRIAIQYIQYAMWWAGSTVAISDKFPAFGYPVSEALQYNKTIEFTDAPKASFTLSATLAIEEDKVTVTIDWLDTTPVWFYSCKIPTLNLELAFGESDLGVDGKFEKLG